LKFIAINNRNIIKRVNELSFLDHQYRKKEVKYIDTEYKKNSFLDHQSIKKEVKDIDMEYKNSFLEAIN
jgi:hypothetical protein